MRSPSSLRWVALAIGAPLTVLGLFGVGVYVAGVVGIVAEQPADRSWLFLGLGLAFMGATALVAGVALLFLWRHLGRQG